MTAPLLPLGPLSFHLSSRLVATTGHSSSSFAPTLFFVCLLPPSVGIPDSRGERQPDDEPDTLVPLV